MGEEGSNFRNEDPLVLGILKGLDLNLIMTILQGAVCAVDNEPHKLHYDYYNHHLWYTIKLWRRFDHCQGQIPP